jgi:hypothetical protein
MTVVQYCIGQYNILATDKALVYRGANAGKCCADMLVLKGSERFVDVIGLAGHKANRSRIVTAQALITTHKGYRSFSSDGFTRNREEYLVVYPNGKPWSRYQ